MPGFELLALNQVHGAVLEGRFDRRDAAPLELCRPEQVQEVFGHVNSRRWSGPNPNGDALILEPAPRSCRDPLQAPGSDAAHLESGWLAQQALRVDAEAIPIAKQGIVQFYRDVPSDSVGPGLRRPR